MQSNFLGNTPLQFCIICKASYGWEHAQFYIFVHIIYTRFLPWECNSLVTWYLCHKYILCCSWNLWEMNILIKTEINFFKKFFLSICQQRIHIWETKQIPKVFLVKCISLFTIDLMLYLKCEIIKYGKNHFRIPHSISETKI